MWFSNNDHYEGYNDRFSIANYNNAALYGKRINEVIEFKKIWAYHI
jgi:hypothetical protein